MNKLRQLRYLEEEVKNLRGMINEILTSPYSYDIDEIDWGQWGAEISASFTSASIGYNYTMVVSYTTVDDDVVLIGAIEFADEDDELKLTGKGDAFRVMATVIDISRDIVTHKNIINKFVDSVVKSNERKDYDTPQSIEILTFSASMAEPSRVRLYERIAKSIPGYRLVSKRDGLFFLLSDKMPAEKQENLIRQEGF